MTENEKVFKEVQKQYAKAEKCILDLGRKVKEAVKEEDVEAALCTYDRILQSILLKEALADGFVAPEEVELIKNTVNHGDIMQLFACFSPEGHAFPVDWASLSLLPVELQKSIGARADILLEASSDEFAFFIALANMATRKDYAQVLIDATTDILTSFSAFTVGNGAKALETGAEAFGEIFVDKYVKILRHIDELCSAAELLESARSFVLSELERYEKQALREQRKERIKEKFRAVFGGKEE